MTKRIASLTKDITKYELRKKALACEVDQIVAESATLDKKIEATRELIKQLGGDDSSDGPARPSAQPMSR